MNESLDTAGGCSVLRIERRLAHPPEKVWRAVTEPAHLTQWFPADLEVDLRVGGRISFVFRDDEARRRKASSPSSTSLYERTVVQDCHVMRRITAVIASPRIGSPRSKPSATTIALATTARETSPSARAW